MAEMIQELEGGIGNTLLLWCPCTTCEAVVLFESGLGLVVNVYCKL